MYVRFGRTERALAGEVVLSAGALNSPRILMLSGVAPEAELSRHGIKVKVSSPDVGHNLQDHPQVSVSARCRLNMGYAKDAKGLPMLAAGVRYYLTRKGPAASNGIESMFYFNPDDPNGEPTIQSLHSPVIADEERGSPRSYVGLTFDSVVLQPRSRGRMTLMDANPRSSPVFDPNYLSDPEDLRLMVAGIRYCLEVLKAPALQKIMDPEMLPGLEVDSDEGLAEHAKRDLTSMWHPVGTCRMGA